MSAPLLTTPPRWHGPTLGDDAETVRALLDEVAGDQDVVLTEDPESVETVRALLVDLGLWIVGAPEQAGGADADLATTMVVTERLGRFWPALGWASVQAHATAVALGAEPAGAYAVVDAAAPHVRLDRTGETVTGTIDRVDAAHAAPHVLVLDGPLAYRLEPDLATVEPVARTGLAGALTCSLSYEGAPVHAVDVDTAGVRVILRRGAAALLAGVAGAAADTAAAYASDRHQFGGPLTNLPTVRQSLDGQVTPVRATLSALWGAGDDPVLLAAAHRDIADAVVDVCAAALQTHGGYGYLTEYPAERYLRDAVSLRAATASVHPYPQEDR